MAIVLSLLSYSYDGLSREELRQAVQQLLKMGKNAQKEHYQQWLQQAQLGAWSELKPGEVFGKGLKQGQLGQGYSAEVRPEVWLQQCSRGSRVHS